MKNIRGLSLQLLKLLLLAGICAAIFFLAFTLCGKLLIRNHFPGSKLQLQMVERRIIKFQDYISDNKLAAADTAELLSWCDRQPMVLMEIYRNNILYFNSTYIYTDPLNEQNIETPRYDWYSYYNVKFADGPAEVLIYSDESYVLNSWITITATVLSGGVFFIAVFVGIRRTIRYIYLLCDEIQMMGNGDLEHPVTIRGNNEIGLLAKELDQMRSALFYHRQKEQDMIRQNNDIITRLSHDLRTPLTKMLLYTEIVESERYEDKEQLLLYLARIHEKGNQIKEISDHLLKYSLSKRESGALGVQKVSFSAALFEHLSEMADYLAENGFIIECDDNWPEMEISINELYLERILDNIASNIDKYAERACPVIIRFRQNDQYAGIMVSNRKSSGYEQSESNGVGIESIYTMMQQMKGKCMVEQSKTEYAISVLFLRSKS